MKDNKRKEQRELKEKLKPNGFLWFIYVVVSKIITHFKYHLKIDKKVFKARNKKEGCVIIYNHCCDDDHFITTSLFGFTRVNYVMTKRFAFNKKLNRLLKGVKAICREQFRPDMPSTLKMRRVTSNGGVICIAPAGQETTDGMMPYIHPSIIKLIKMCKVDVYTCQITGSYLAHPKWGKNKRRYPISCKVVKTLSKDELQKESVNYCLDKILTDLDINDFDHQAIAKTKIGGQNIANGLEDFLYWCPKCHEIETMKVSNNNLSCTKCGYGIHYDNYGFFNALDNEPLIYKNEHEWFDAELNDIKEKIRNNNLVIKDKVVLYSDLHDPKALLPLGEGVLTFDSNSFYYDGTLDGVTIHKEFNLNSLYQLPFAPGRRFNVPDEEGMFEFTCENRYRVVEFVLAIEAYYFLKEEIAANDN